MTELERIISQVEEELKRERPRTFLCLSPYDMSKDLLHEIIEFGEKYIEDFKFHGKLTRVFIYGDTERGHPLLLKKLEHLRMYQEHLTDLFLDSVNLPKKVRKILSQFDEDGNLYMECSLMLDRLSFHQYTFDYGLDGCPFNLRKLEYTPFVKLKSVGAVLHVKNKIVYPLYSNGGIDRHSGTHIDDCSKYWRESLSKKDIKKVLSLTL